MVRLLSEDLLRAFTGNDSLNHQNVDNFSSGEKPVIYSKSFEDDIEVEVVAGSMDGDDAVAITGLQDGEEVFTYGALEVSYSSAIGIANRLSKIVSDLTDPFDERKLYKTLDGISDIERWF